MRIRVSALVVVVLTAACASTTKDAVKEIIKNAPPIVITVPAPAPKPSPAPEPSVPPVVEPAAPAPQPEAPPVQLQNLNILVLDAAAAPVRGGYCVVDRDRRFADGGGFINFAVPGSVFADCAAPGFLLRHLELPPGDHRVHLEMIPESPRPPPPPVPDAPPPAAGALCTERVSNPISCVRQAAARYAELLTVNTFESCVEFTQRVLELLGPDWGHVGKTAGEGQSVPKGFTPIDVLAGDGLGHAYHITGVSHDAIKHRLTGQVVDLLGNATANEPCDPAKVPDGKCWKPGPASIQWTLIPPQYWRAENPFVPAVAVR